MGKNVRAREAFSRRRVAGSVHTPACAADDFTMTSRRRIGGSIRRVQFSWTPATSLRRALVTIQSQASIHGLISALSRPCYVIWGRSRLRQIIMAGQLSTEYLPGYLGSWGDIWDNTQSPQVPILSPTGGNLRIMLAVWISYACKSVSELPSSSFSFASQQQLFGFATSATYQRHWTSRPFLLNHVQYQGHWHHCYSG